jgi:hypothetical protein
VLWLLIATHDFGLDWHGGNVSRFSFLPCRSPSRLSFVQHGSGDGRSLITHLVTVRSLFYRWTFDFLSHPDSLGGSLYLPAIKRASRGYKVAQNRFFKYHCLMHLRLVD